MQEKILVIAQSMFKVPSELYYEYVNHILSDVPTDTNERGDYYTKMYEIRSRVYLCEPMDIEVFIELPQRNHIVLNVENFEVFARHKQ